MVPKPNWWMLLSHGPSEPFLDQKLHSMRMIFEIKSSRCYSHLLSLTFHALDFFERYRFERFLENFKQTHLESERRWEFNRFGRRISIYFKWNKIARSYSHSLWMLPRSFQFFEIRFLNANAFMSSAYLLVLTDSNGRRSINIWFIYDFRINRGHRMTNVTRQM